MSDATFARPDLTAFAGLDDLGLEVVGQRLEPRRAVLACRVLEPDRRCRRCGCEGRPRHSVVRRLAHEPFGWRPTVLEITVRRYACTGCVHVWRQDTTAAAAPRSKLSRRALAWALEGLVVQLPDRRPRRRDSYFTPPRPVVRLAPGPDGTVQAPLPAATGGVIGIELCRSEAARARRLVRRIGSRCRHRTLSRPHR